MTVHHFHNLRISKIQAETDDAVSIVFAVPKVLQDLYQYTQGQHLVVKADLEGQEIRRSYSICSGVNEKELCVAVKKVKGGKFSSFVHDSLQKNDSLAVMPPEGNFFTPLIMENRKHYLAFAAGSGITPILSILKSVLAVEPSSRFTLVYGNKTVTSMMFRETLLGLKNRYPTRLELINILSRQEQESELLNGRIDAEKIKALCERMIALEVVNEVFICGPLSMTEAVKETLVQEGFDPKHIHFELFGLSPTERVVEAKPSDPGPLRKVSVIVDGKQTNIEVTEGGQSILDVALSAGADLPFACKGGVCCTCRAKLLEGEVRMDVNYALEEGEVERGFILTCQSHPLTDRVVIDFDEK